PPGATGAHPGPGLGAEAPHGEPHLEWLYRRNLRPGARRRSTGRQGRRRRRRWLPAALLPTRPPALRPRRPPPPEGAPLRPGTRWDEGYFQRSPIERGTWAGRRALQI